MARASGAPHSLCGAGVYMIYMFGGSTFRGRIRGTIPSPLAQQYANAGGKACVRNDGEVAWVSHAGSDRGPPRARRDLTLQAPSVRPIADDRAFEGDPSTGQDLVRLDQVAQASEQRRALRAAGSALPLQPMAHRS